MTAVEVLPYDAPRELWLAERRKGVGGSDVPAVLGMSRWSSPRKVWLDKTTDIPDRVPTWHMQIGTALEAVMLNHFTTTSGVGHRRVGLLRSKDEPWMQVSLDAYTDDGGIAECKWVGFRMAGEWADDQVSDHAELQAQWGMAVSGRSHAWVIAAISEDEPVARRVARDDDLIRDITDQCRTFWDSHVHGGTEPALTARDLSPIRDEWPTVERSYALGDTAAAAAVEDYLASSAPLDLYTNAKNRASAVIVAAIADAEALVIRGEVWATRAADKNGKRTLRITKPSNRKALSHNG